MDVGKKAAAIRRNARSLASYVRSVYLSRIDLYTQVLTGRLLPALSDEEISKEAERVENEAFERLGASVPPEDYHPGDFVDDARGEAVAYMLNLRDARQAVISTFAAGLYHRFEQQLSKFLRIALWEREKEFQNMGEVADTFASIGLDVRKLPGWSTIEELRLIANCTKHAEGDSCRQLRKSRPDLFVRPLWSGEAEYSVDDSFVHSFVEEPLAGEGMYLTEKEFRAKVEATKAFWIALAEAVEAF